MKPAKKVTKGLVAKQSAADKVSTPKKNKISDSGKPKVVKKAGPKYTLNFGEAIYLLKLGKKLSRKGWNGKKMWIVYVAGKTTSKMNLAPYISMKTVSGKLQENNMQPGWLASQADMLSTDWSVID